MQHFFKQRLAEIDKKIKQMLRIIHILHPRYHTKMCLYSWDYAINHNENEEENEKKIR